MKAPCCAFVGGTLLLLSFFVPFSSSAEIRVVGANGSTVTIPENHLDGSLVDDLLSDCVGYENLCRREIAVDVARVISFLVKSSNDESRPTGSGSNLFPCEVFQSQFAEEQEADIKKLVDPAWKDIFEVAQTIADVLKRPSEGEFEARSIHSKYVSMQALQVARKELKMRSALAESLFEQVVELSSLHLNWHDPSAIVDRDLFEEMNDYDPHRVRMAFSKEVLQGITTLATTLGYVSYEKQCPDVSSCPGKLVLGHSPRNMPDVSGIDEEITEAIMVLSTSYLEEDLRNAAADNNNVPSMTERDAVDLTALINTISVFYPNMLPKTPSYYTIPDGARHFTIPDGAIQHLMMGLDLLRRLDGTVDEMVKHDISEVELNLEAAESLKSILESVGKVATTFVNNTVVLE